MVLFESPRYEIRAFDTILYSGDRTDGAGRDRKRWKMSLTRYGEGYKPVNAIVFIQMRAAIRREVDGEERSGKRELRIGTGSAQRLSRKQRNVE